MNSKLEESTRDYYNYKAENKKSKKYLFFGLGCLTYLGVRAIFGEVNLNEPPENLWQKLDLFSTIFGSAGILYGGLGTWTNSIIIKHSKKELEKQKEIMPKITNSTVIFSEEQPKNPTLN